MFSYEGEKRRKNSDLTFPEDEVKLAKTMMDELKTTMEFFHYLMNHRGESSLSMILLSSDDVKLDQLLPKWKRQSDILFELDRQEVIFEMVEKYIDIKEDKKANQVFFTSGENTNIVYHTDKT